jgi:hypothetical protein
MKTDISRNTITLIGVVSFFMLLLLSMLIYFNIQKRYGDLRSGTARFVISDIVSYLENSLNLGLQLNEMQNISSELKRQCAVAPFINAVSIHSINGTTILSSSKQTADIIDNKILERLKPDSSSRYMQTFIGSNGFILSFVNNTFGYPEFIVSVNYNRYNRQEFSKLFLQFLLLSFGLAVCITLIAIIPVYRLFSPVNKEIVGLYASDDFYCKDLLKNTEGFEPEKVLSNLVNDLQSSLADNSNKGKS